MLIVLSSLMTFNSSVYENEPNGVEYFRYYKDSISLIANDEILRFHKNRELFVFSRWPILIIDKIIIVHKFKLIICS